MSIWKLKESPLEIPRKCVPISEFWLSTLFTPKVLNIKKSTQQKRKKLLGGYRATPKFHRHSPWKVAYPKKERSVFQLYFFFKCELINWGCVVVSNTKVHELIVTLDHSTSWELLVRRHLIKVDFSPQLFLGLKRKSSAYFSINFLFRCSAVRWLEVFWSCSLRLLV